MASTGTGSSGRKPVSQPKGDVTNPQPMKDASKSTVTKRLYRKYFMSLSNIFLIIKPLDMGVTKTPNTANYPNNNKLLDNRV